MNRAIIIAALLLAGCDGMVDDRFWPKRIEVIDGDTFRAQGTTYRLARIDTPEMAGHCRKGRACVEGDPFVAKDALVSAMGYGPVVCRPKGDGGYGRVLVECWADGRNISDIMLIAGHAELYRKPRG